MKQIKASTRVLALFIVPSLTACGGATWTDIVEEADFVLPETPTTLADVNAQRQAILPHLIGREDLLVLPETGIASMIGDTAMTYENRDDQSVLRLYGQTRMEANFTANTVNGTADNFVVMQGLGVNPDGLPSSHPDYDSEQLVIPVDGTLALDSVIARDGAFQIRGTVTGELSINTDDHGVVIATDAPYSGRFTDDGGLWISTASYGTNDTSISVDGVVHDDFTVLTETDLIPE